MSAKTERIINDLTEAIKNIGTSKTSAFDAKAVITRVEQGKAWVHFDGGEAETPVELTINAMPGDEVQVRVSNGYAFIVGNTSAPPTDDRMAILASENAIIAKEAADSAIEDAASADAAANAAQASADAAQASADAANVSAISANTSANNALTQLSTVENVVGTLSWIAEHGTYRATTDTTVIPGKYYFTRTGSGTTTNPYQYAVVTNPESDPSAAGYYELDSIDEAVSNYVSTHVALTNEGLFLTLDDSGYKLKLTNTGAYIIDPAGAEVAEYSTVTNIGATEVGHVHIDDDSVDIMDGTTVLASFGATTVIGNQNGAHIEASGDRLSFKDGDGNEVAYVAVDDETNESVFYMTKAIVVKDLFFGYWRWDARSNDNLALKWVGSEEEE